MNEKEPSIDVSIWLPDGLIKDEMIKGMTNHPKVDFKQIGSCFSLFDERDNVHQGLSDEALEEDNPLVRIEIDNVPLADIQAMKFPGETYDSLPASADINNLTREDFENSEFWFEDRTVTIENVTLEIKFFSVTADNDPTKPEKRG